MSPLDPKQAEELVRQRKAARNAYKIGRRWYLRAALMVVVGVVALYRGGQFNTMLGIGLMLVAALSSSLGHGIRKGAKASEEKISLMEKMG